MNYFDLKAKIKGPIFSIITPFKENENIYENNLIILGIS